jgi:hypothetical protein
LIFLIGEATYNNSNPGFANTLSSLYNNPGKHRVRNTPYKKTKDLNVFGLSYSFINDPPV